MYDALVTRFPESIWEDGEGFWSDCLSKMHAGAFAFVILPSMNQLSVARLGRDLANAGWRTDFTTTAYASKDSRGFVVCAMAPLSEKTFVAQAMADGHGVTWFNDCRVPTEENLNGGAYSGNERGEGEWKDGSGFKNDVLEGQYAQPEGRFPANVLIQDDVLNDGSLSKDTGHFPKERKMMTYEGGLKGGEFEEKHMTGEGSNSRFFDLDKVAEKHGWSPHDALPLYFVTMSTREGQSVYDPFNSIEGLPESIGRERGVE